MHWCKPCPEGGSYLRKAGQEAVPIHPTSLCIWRANPELGSSTNPEALQVYVQEGQRLVERTNRLHIYQLFCQYLCGQGFIHGLGKLVTSLQATCSMNCPL